MKYRRRTLSCFLIIGFQALVLSAQLSVDPGDVLLDWLLWSPDTIAIKPDIFTQPLRAEVEQYLQRAQAYRPKQAAPSDPEARMLYEGRLHYEQKLAGVSSDPDAPDLAAAYFESLRPCYEWEGGYDCPEREARFADRYQAAHPNGPFHSYLPLLSAHRWLCTAEAYEREGRSGDAERSRRLYEQRLKVARASTSLMIRTAADRLAERGRCFASR